MTFDDLAKLIKKNITTLVELHSLVGKLNHAAGLLIIIRPFLEPLWAALYSDVLSGAPRNTVWTKQIISSLSWFQVLFTRDLPVERFFRLDSYSGKGKVVEIGTDASPWGMGGGGSPYPVLLLISSLARWTTMTYGYWE